MAIITNTTGIVGNYQSTATETSTILRNLQSTVYELRNEMVRLRGFYEWMIHAYPETIAQYKALMDLQRASNQGEAVAKQESAAYERYAR